MCSEIRAINASEVFVHSQGDYPLKSISPYHSPMVMNVTSLTAQPNLYMGQLAIVNTSNSAHSIGSVTSNGDMHVDQDAVSKHDMELNNTSPPHQPIIRYADSDADADADYDDDDGQAKDEAMLLTTGTVQLSSSALYQNGTIAHAECLDFSTTDPQLYGLR